MFPKTSRFAAVLLIGSLAVAPAFAQTDTLQSQTPSQSQSTAPSHGGRLAARFDAANTTHDGKLTLAQAQAAQMTMVVRHFDAIDTQHHGYVTLADLQAYRQQMRAERQSSTATKPD